MNEIIEALRQDYKWALAQFEKYKAIAESYYEHDD
jgi:hypothetical protein